MSERELDTKLVDFKIDSQRISVVMNNLIAALDQGCVKGAYGLKQAGQLCQDLEYLGMSLAKLSMQVDEHNKEKHKSGI
jgi:hypothetical protein